MMVFPWLSAVVHRLLLPPEFPMPSRLAALVVSRASRTAHRAGMLFVMCLFAVPPARLAAQEDPGRSMEDTTTIRDTTYKNTTAGEFTPARGFDLVRTKWSSLNISFYGLFRYMNQMPGTQTFTDHLGRERTVKARNDLNWHRTFVWLTGFFWDPRFRYNISLWSLPTTQQ